jgi:hypothetical protein
MKNRHCNEMKRSSLALILVLVVLTSTYRVVSAIWLTSLPNFSPVMALALCCGLVLPGVWAAAIPLGCLFVTDLLLNAHFGQPLFGAGTLAIYACYLFAIGSGALLRNRGWKPVMGTVLANAILFYLVTNTLAWSGNLHYPQNLAGWIQSLTVGRPGFPPTWTFFRNSLLGDLMFAGGFLGLLHGMKNRGKSPAPANQERAL